METAGPWETIKQLSRSHQSRVIQLVFLVLILQIPVLMIREVIGERRGTRDEAVREVTSKWGDCQTIMGPKVVVPYHRRYTETNSKGVEEIRTQRSYACFMPDALDVTSRIDTEVRYRGIYKVLLYRMTSQFTGSFKKPDFSGWEIAPEDVLWSDAYVEVDIADTGSILGRVQMTWNGKEIEFEPGAGEFPGDRKGIHAPIGAATNIENATFSFPLTLNGSEGAYFAPVGMRTRVSLESNWFAPSFQGEWLPITWEPTPEGFKAEWDIPYLGRNTPQRWIHSESPPTLPTFGVNLITPVDQYRMAERSCKYALLFLCLTLGSLWLFEVLVGIRIHTVQYLLVSAAMCLFFLLELSLSEHIGFMAAYGLATLGVVSAVVAYCVTVLHQLRRAFTIGSVLVVLYGYLYVVLQNQDYALLMGSLGLFMGLCAVMYLTRNVDWSAGRKE